MPRRRTTDSPTTARRVLVYYFWGVPHMHEAIRSATVTKAVTGLAAIAITDAATRDALPDYAPFSEIVTVTREHDSLLAKSGIYDSLPDAYDSFLFLDTDATVIMDVTYAFEKAEEYGIAAAMAPHYSLDHFWGFDRVMSGVDVAGANQLQYNTGALFFSRRPDVAAVFRQWRELALTLGPRFDFYNDQPFFTLALEQLHFNPFTLSPAYNYRALGELASGRIRIWHSHAPVPAAVNTFQDAWPPRRFSGAATVAY